MSNETIPSLLDGSSKYPHSPLGLGTAALAIPYGPPGRERQPIAEGEAVEVVEHAVDCGLRFIDTAPAYGAAEAIVGAATAGVGCTIATKLAIPQQGWDALSKSDLRSAVRSSVESSLSALRRDCIDVLQIHNADAVLISNGDLVNAIHELKEEGLVGVIGATTYGERNALAAINADEVDLVQVAYSALDRRPESAVLGAADDAGVQVVSRSTLLHGVLTAAGQSLNGELAALTSAANSFREAIGAEWAQLAGAAVAWAVTRPDVATVLLGPRDESELDELLAGATRFMRPALSLDDSWQRELSPDLLDPSCWPRQDAQP